MSTETLTQTAAPGTPGSEPTPLVQTAKSMIGDAFKNSPVEPAKTATTAVESAPAKTAEPAKPATPPKYEPVIKAKEAPPVATDFPEDKLEIPKNASPEAVQNFKQYKESMKSILAAERKRVSDAEAQLAVHKNSAPADTAEIQAKEARLKAAEDRLAVLDLQSHPDFVRQYSEPKKRAIATATEVIGYNGKEGVELAPILSKPLKEFNAAVSEYTKDMNSADAATVAMSLRQAREIHAAEQTALSKSSELQQQFQSKTAQEQKKAFESVASEVIPNFAKREINDTMTPEQKVSAQKYNESVDTLRNRAESRAFGKVSERDVATMAFKEVAFEHMVQHVVPTLETYIASQSSVIADLTAQLEAVKGARNPGTVSGDRNAGAPAQASIKDQVGAAFKGRL